MVGKAPWAAVFIAIMALIGAVLSGPENRIVPPYSADNSKTVIRFYTAASATFPQMPLWSAIQAGRLESLVEPEIHIYKNLDDLQGVLLAGRGDLWLGSVEVFARARQRGAPLKLLVVSGWRKFYLLSRDPAVTGFESPAARSLVYGPPGSPAGALLSALMNKGLPRFELCAMEPRAMALMVLDGRLDTCLAPEPLVTELLHRVPDLRVVGNLSEIYGKISRCPGRLPLAGFAVHESFARRHPALVQRLSDILVEEGKRIAIQPEIGIRSLPADFRKHLSTDQLMNSCLREMILTLPATEVEQEIRAYLDILGLPPADAGQAYSGHDFFWR